MKEFIKLNFLIISIFIINNINFKIVLNTFSNGEWGKEERKSNPFKRGEAFDIRIRAHDDRFQVFYF